MADQNKLYLGTNKDTYIAADDAGNIVFQNERGGRAVIDNEGVKFGAEGAEPTSIGGGGGGLNYSFNLPPTTIYDSNGSPDLNYYLDFNNQSIVKMPGGYMSNQTQYDADSLASTLNLTKLWEDHFGETINYSLLFSVAAPPTSGNNYLYEPDPDTPYLPRISFDVEVLQTKRGKSTSYYGSYTIKEDLILFSGRDIAIAPDLTDTSAAWMDISGGYPPDSYFWKVNHLDALAGRSNVIASNKNTLSTIGTPLLFQNHPDIDTIQELKFDYYLGYQPAGINWSGIGNEYDIDVPSWWLNNRASTNYFYGRKTSLNGDLVNFFDLGAFYQDGDDINASKNEGGLGFGDAPFVTCTVAFTNFQFYK